MKSWRKSRANFVAGNDTDSWPTVTLPAKEQHMDFSVGWTYGLRGWMAWPVGFLQRRLWPHSCSNVSCGKTFPKREWWFQWYFWIQHVHHCFVKVLFHFTSCFFRWVSTIGSMTASVSSRFGEVTGSKVSLLLTLRTSTHGIGHLVVTLHSICLWYFNISLAKVTIKRKHILLKLNHIYVLESLFSKAGHCTALAVFRFFFRVKSRHWFQEQDPWFRVNFTNFESFARFDVMFSKLPNRLAKSAMNLQKWTFWGGPKTEWPGHPSNIVTYLWKILGNICLFNSISKHLFQGSPSRVLILWL